MNENPESNANPASASTPTAPGTGPARPSLPRIAASLVAACVLAVVGYSLYVAVHEPDPQETVLLGQTQIASGSPAALRLVVRHRVSSQPVQGARVELSLWSKPTGQLKLGTFRTDATGSLAEPIQIPEIGPGKYRLTIDTSSALGRDHIVKEVEVQQPTRVLLSSDKPLYQPGQTIHLRSLLIDSRTQKPLVKGPVTFEVSDPKGNKVFKESRQASAFGIASADFVLATELNLGRYTLRALVGAVSVERTIEVKRYVLPKFKIQVNTDKPYYLPGQVVSGDIQARYFFGQPVSDASLKLTAATYQEKPVTITEFQGRTDRDGHYAFQFTLPDFFTGMPQKDEQAFLDLAVEVQDTAQHVERTALSLSVARQDLEVSVIPEAGVLVPGVENLVYVLTAYPDGRPAVCKVFIDGTAYPSDAQGVTEIQLAPTATNQPIELQALDAAGRKAKLTYRPEQAPATPPLLLRADKAVYQAGQAAQLTLLSAEKTGTVFLDVIQEGQTVLTKSLSLNGDKAHYTLPLPASLVGTLKLHAYVVTQSGEDRGCSRLIYVHPASGLRVASSLSQAVYRPGEVARLDLRVTDAQGRPAVAALGIAAVDESLFALHENRPGLLQQFLDAEGELLKPRYQIKMFDSPAQCLADAAGEQALAKAYLASLNGPAADLQIDNLIRDSYISQKTIEHARALRGTPAYEKLRNNPQYVELIRLLEGGYGNYSLREATGAAKLYSAEAQRKAYFKKLKEYLLTGLCGLLFLSPFLLLLYYSRPGAGTAPERLSQAQVAPFVQAASASFNLLAVLTLFPLICYPLGALALEQSHIGGEGWILLAFETLVVFGTLLLQLFRLEQTPAAGRAWDLSRVRACLWAFLAQFGLSRLGFVCLVLFECSEGWYGLLFLLSLIPPLVVVGTLSSRVRHQLELHGVTLKVARLTLVEVLIVLSLLCLLAAMLLPSLARAKSRAQSLSLMSDLKQLELATRTAQEDAAPADASRPGLPRLRRDFPETLLWRPELITDEQGKATLEIPLADSITTWRASIDGISAAGAMGSTELPIPVFQDFFVDLDLPVTMALGDQVFVPVTCYNYLKVSQAVHLTLAEANWFESPRHELSLQLGPNEVKSVRFPITVRRVGEHTLRVTAQGTTLADAIERGVRVLPTGTAVELTRNEVLKGTWEDSFTVPAGAIPDSQHLLVKCYPSRFSEIVEGLESIFQAPYGCFEQTSSTTYPNVLVLDYLKRMNRLTPEVEVKARKYINAGYQRLLTFEVSGGGFEWFGHTPANICLTAYGILEFTDMARVHPVDEAMIARTRKWLFAQQRHDGSWEEIHRGWTWAGRGSMTAFVAWALAESGDQSPNLDRALNYLRTHPEELSTLYSKALAANAFLARDRADTFGRALATQLQAAALADSHQALHWTSKGCSMTYSHDSGLDVETTALAAMALMKATLWPQSVKQALTWISQTKSATGTWGSTQATILAMRALLQASAASLGQDFTSSITLALNGQVVETFQLTPQNSDVMRHLDLSRHLCPGKNRIELRQNPVGELPFQVAGAYWLPALSETRPASSGPSASAKALQIDLQYDRTTLAVNDQLQCAVTVKNNTPQAIPMAIVDLGIPPGFDVDSTAFETMQQQEQIAKFEVTGNQVILYLRELSNAKPFEFQYSLRAKYPLRVQTPPSAVYEYYQPQNRAQTRPVILQAAGN